MGVSEPQELPIYALLGETTLTAIVAAFYRRVPQDPILGPMYPPDDLAGAEHRLRIRHAPFAIDTAARDRWLALMLAAIDEVGVAAEYRAYLERFLGDIATFLINRGS